MSQLVLDDQLDVQIIVPALEGWISVVRLQEIRPGEHILDDRVPAILRTLKSPTFVTIDHGFWNRRLCHSAYCILYFPIAKDDQESVAPLLRRVFRLLEFRSRAERMGKVARVGARKVTFWEAGAKQVVELPDSA